MGTLTSCLSKAGKAIDPDDARDIRARVRNLIADEKMDLKAASLEAIQTQIDIANDDLKMIYEAAGLPWEVETPAVLKSTPRPAQPKAQEKAKADTKFTANQAEDRLGGPARSVESWALQAKPDKTLPSNASPVRRKATAAWKAAKGLVSQIANTDRTLFEMMRRMDNEVRESVAELQQSVKRVENAIKESVDYAFVNGKRIKAPKGGRRDLRLTDINSLLDKANNETDSKAQEKARMRLAKDYPLVYAAWQEQRLDIDKMSLAFMKEIHAKNGGLTNKDIRLLREMKKNIGTYLTRQYAAFKGPEIRDAHFQKVLNDWKNYSSLTPEQISDLKDDERVFEMAKNYIKSHWLDIGEFNEVAKAAREDMDPVSMDRFKELYAAWVPQEVRMKNQLPTDATVDQRIAYMDQAEADMLTIKNMLSDEGMYEKRLDEKAVMWVDDIINAISSERMNALVQYYQTAPGEGGILKQRRNPPKEIRALLGEITQPILQMHQTIFEMKKEQARIRFISGLYEGMEGVMWVDSADRRGDSAETFSTQLKGDKFGPLNGKWVRKDIADSLSTLEEMSNSLDGFIQAMAAGRTEAYTGALAAYVLRAPRRVTIWWKKAQIVMNTMNMLADFISTNQSILADGNIPWADKEAREFAFGAAFYLINSADRTKLSDSAKEALRTGMIESAVMGEVQRENMENWERVFLSTFNNREEAQKFIMDRVNSGAKTLGEKTMRLGGIVDRTISDMKAMSDVVGKLYNYKMEKKFLQKLEDARVKDNPDYKRKTDAEIERDAATTIDDTNIGYHRAPPIAKALETLPVGVLFNFMSEAARTTINRPRVAKGLVQAALSSKKKGATNESQVLRSRAIARSMGAFLNIVANETLVKMTMRGIFPILLASAFLGEDDEEERKKMLEEAQALTDQFVAAMPPEQRSMGWIYGGKDAKGNPIFFNSSRFGVNEPVAQPFINMVRGIATGDQEYIDRGTKGFANIFVGSPVVGKIIDVANDKDPTIKRTHPEMHRLLGDELSHIYDFIAPRQGRQLLQLTSEESSVADLPAGARSALGFGATLKVYDPKLDLRYASFDYKTAKADASKSVLDVLEKGGTEQEIIDAYATGVNKIAEASKLLINNVTMSRMLGKDDNVITEILTEGAGGQKGAALSKGDVANILEGLPTTVIVSDASDSVEKLKASEIKKIEDRNNLSDQQKAVMIADIESRFERYDNVIATLNGELTPAQKVRDGGSSNKWKWN